MYKKHWENSLLLEKQIEFTLSSSELQFVAIHPFHP